MTRAAGPALREARPLQRRAGSLRLRALRVQVAGARPPASRGARRGDTAMAGALSVALHLVLLAGLWAGHARSQGGPRIASPMAAAPMAVELVKAPRAAGGGDVPRALPRAPVGRVATERTRRRPHSAGKNPVVLPAPPQPSGPVRLDYAIAATTRASPSVEGRTRAKSDGLGGRSPPGGGDGAEPAVVLSAAVPRDEYPAEARRRGFEGVVLQLRLVVDERGRVSEATVTSDPGHGLGEAAARAARRHFVFQPARPGGAPVRSEVPFTLRFVLPRS